MSKHSPSSIESSNGACSEYSAGLEGAMQIASCLYDPADKDRPSGGRESCYSSCNFGVR